MILRMMIMSMLRYMLITRALPKMSMLGKRTADIITATQQGKFQGRDEVDEVKAEGIDASSMIPFRGFDSDVVLKLLDSQRLAPWDYPSKRLCALVFFALLLRRTYHWVWSADNQHGRQLFRVPPSWRVELSLLRKTLCFVCDSQPKASPSGARTGTKKY